MIRRREFVRGVGALGAASLIGARTTPTAAELRL
jgi:hypothetical protein